MFASFKEELDEIPKMNYLSDDEKSSLQGYNNKAVQLLDKQSQSVQYLFTNKAINLTQQVTLQEVLITFMTSREKPKG